jgi:cell wall-associated NlpC family hydrolase
MLCGDHNRVSDIRSALFSYNHSTEYVDAVLAQADLYGSDDASGAAAGPTFTGDGRSVVAFALTQIGVPYQWGGTTPGVELDCSGLVVVSYRAIGLTLPRTTFEQARLGVSVPLTELQPGDLLFFSGGRPTHDLGHVTIYAGNGQMVTAPRTGSTVTVEPVPYAAVQLVRRILVPGR